MKGASLLAVENLLRSRLAPTRDGTNHDIYDKRLTLQYPWQPFTYVPRCIYFYYLQVSKNGKLFVEHYFYNDGPDPSQPKTWDPIPHAAVPNIIQYLALGARAGTAPGKLPGGNFENIVWNRISYITVFVDEANWSFHQHGPGRVALAFNVNKDSEPNHSFFDAANFTLRMPIHGTPNFDDRSGVYFVNHMKRDEDGTELGDGLAPGVREQQTFVFEMFLDVDYVNATATPMTVVLDPGGTNDGPPEQP